MEQQNQSTVNKAYQRKEKENQQEWLFSEMVLWNFFYFFFNDKYFLKELIDKYTFCYLCLSVFRIQSFFYPEKKHNVNFLVLYYYDDSILTHRDLQTKAE